MMAPCAPESSFHCEIQLKLKVGEKRGSPPISEMPPWPPCMTLKETVVLASLCAPPIWMQGFCVASLGSGFTQRLELMRLPEPGYWPVRAAMENCTTAEPSTA